MKEKVNLVKVFKVEEVAILVFPAFIVNWYVQHAVADVKEAYAAVPHECDTGGVQFE